MNGQAKKFVIVRELLNSAAWLLLAWIICGVLCAHAWPNDFFQWSPAGKSHHAAACIVRGDNGNTGSGTYVDAGGLRGVLTCAHLNCQSITVTFADGSTAVGSLVVERDRNDIGWIDVTSTTIAPLAIASSQPQPGETVEFVTRGGPESKLRHWFGRAITTETEFDERARANLETFKIDSCITHGDSGGAVVNMAGQVVGVSVAGVTEVYSQGGQHQIYRGARSPGFRPLRNFLDRLRGRTGCPGGVCPPRQPYGNFGPSPYYPPPQPMPPAPPAPIQPPAQQLPTPPAPQSVDVDKLLDALAADPRFKGPPGNEGERGRDASAEQLDQLAKRIAAIEAAKISIEMFDAAGKLQNAQSRAIVGDKPFYFGQRPAK